jgi:hypothetical protein
MNAESELPEITTSLYTSSCVPMMMTGVGDWGNTTTEQETQSIKPFSRTVQELFAKAQATEKPNPQPMSQRRIIQVFIADANDNVPLDQSVLYRGEQKLTDLTDAELYFEIPINDLLKAHNEKRVKWTDKEASKRSGKDIFLDPVRIRELKMVVVTIANF